MRGGLPFDEAAKEELFAELEKDYISGVTFSGGDPLHPANREDIARLAEEIRGRYPNKTIWLYTGYDWEQICEFALLKNIDVVVDGEFIDLARQSQTVFILPLMLLAYPCRLQLRNH